jgi:MFS family permease
VTFQAMTVRAASSIVSAPGAPALLASSIVARLPLAMFSIALLVHAQRLTGSFAVAGLVTGGYAIASATAAPLLGRIIDRCGQTRVLVLAAAASALVLVANGLVPARTPAAVLVALGVAAGATAPPLAACVRTLLPTVSSDPAQLRTLFAFESTVLELTFVFGPPLALGIAALWSPGMALATGGLVMFAGTLLFAAQPASRSWRPDGQPPSRSAGSLRSPAMRTLVLILLGAGAIFGATDIGVTTAAHALGSTAAAGPVLGVWGVGSLLGGICATRLGGGARSTRSLTILLAALALTHGALILTTGSLVALSAVILLAGATIAPTVASIYAMVEAAAPKGTQTEAFSWLLTANLGGSAIGAAIAGELAQQAGAPAAFAFVAAAGGLALLALLLRGRSLNTQTAKPALGTACA